MLITRSSSIFYFIKGQNEAKKERKNKEGPFKRIKDEQKKKSLINHILSFTK